MRENKFEGIAKGMMVDLLDSSGKPIQGIVEKIDLRLVPAMSGSERDIAIKVRAVPYQGGVYRFFADGDPFAHLPGKERLIGIVEAEREKRFRIQTIRRGQMGVVEIDPADVDKKPTGFLK